jgi:peptidoglycan/LPS O-acetylase OafA/YrhL
VPSQTSPSATSRDPSIDTLRAIACIALVSYHVVGDTPVKGMELPPDHWLSLLNGTFIDMRMPLFSFLSGCVFVSLEGLSRSPGRMLLSKMRRLLVPMLSVGLLFWTVRTAMGHDEPPLLSLLVMPYGHFWFLQATFVIMTCFLLLYAPMPGRSAWLATGLMGLGALAWVFGPRPTPNLFSVIQAAYLMPFFMLGYLCTHSAFLTRLKAYAPPMLAGLVLLCLTGLGYALAAGHLLVPGEAARRALTTGIGAVLCLSLMILSPRHPLLARLGGYSYTVYLFHVFFTAASFEGLRALLPGLPEPLIWGAGVCAGLLGPILLHHVLIGNAALSTLFLGLKSRPFRRRPLPVAHSGAAQRA